MSQGIACLKCRLFYRVKKIGVAVEERAQVTVDGAMTWQPYKLWMGDLLECQGCGNQIVARFGQRPLAEHTVR